MLAKKFKRKLPKRNAFIFEDPKEADEFYNYVNTRYQLGHIDVEYNVPFKIDDEEFFFSFHEVERVTNTINLIPIFIDTALKANDKDPLTEDQWTSRSGYWYVAITVADDLTNDVLVSKSPKREKILAYFRQMREEYLSSSNYTQALIRKK